MSLGTPAWGTKDCVNITSDRKTELSAQEKDLLLLETKTSHGTIASKNKILKDFAFLKAPGGSLADFYSGLAPIGQVPNVI